MMKTVVPMKIVKIIAMHHLRISDNLRLLILGVKAREKIKINTS